MTTMTEIATEYLSIKWTISKARDTYGYNVVTLRDESGHKYAALGGGYDMTGTVFAEWLQENHQAELRDIADRAHATYVDGHSTRNDQGLYGFTA